MHAAAQRSEPDGPDLDGDHAAILAESIRLLARLGKGPLSSRLILELVDLNDRLAALKVAYRDHAAEMFVRAQLAELSRRVERGAQPSRPVSPQRPGQPPLMRLVSRP